MRYANENNPVKNNTTYFDLPKLMRSMVLPVSSAGMLIGILGFSSLNHGGEGGDPERLQTFEATRSFSVLAAAPINSSLTGPEGVVCGKLKTPPPYTNVTSLNEQLSQWSPSSCCLVLENDSSRKVIFPNPGTVGISSDISMADPPEDVGGDGSSANAEGECTTVEVWGLPNTSMNEMPAANDPNAIITLDINPPKKKTNSDCTVWHRREGVPPPRKYPHHAPLETPELF